MKDNNLILPTITTILNSFLAAILFIITLPVLIVLMIIIVIDSRGNPIFIQKRIGKNGKTFRFYKLRTMIIDARKRYPKLYNYKYTRKQVENFQFKKDNDPRLTNFGKRLRKTSLDEILNLINIIKGDMNFVGPRPEIPEMLPYYTKKERRKFSVKPGMTGFAQTSGRGYLTFKQTIKYDLFYIKHKSFETDLLLLLKTIKVVFNATGAF